MILYHEENLKELCSFLVHWGLQTDNQPELIPRRCDRTYNIAFKEKDFKVGASLQDESARVMFNSQCIIILLSKAYLSTHECFVEFKNAEETHSKK